MILPLGAVDIGLPYNEVHKAHFHILIGPEVFFTAYPAFIIKPYECIDAAIFQVADQGIAELIGRKLEIWGTHIDLAYNHMHEAELESLVAETAGVTKVRAEAQCGVEFIVSLLAAAFVRSSMSWMPLSYRTSAAFSPEAAMAEL